MVSVSVDKVIRLTVAETSYICILGRIGSHPRLSYREILFRPLDTDEVEPRRQGTHSGAPTPHEGVKHHATRRGDELNQIGHQRRALHRRMEISHTLPL